ncbi:MAG: hypothetical protein RR494_08055 [Vagococcus sp.]|uniref:hypothetical protein n=1 Tax=Vagococcus TaxID=2737 RepID=UPI002FC92DEB
MKTIPEIEELEDWREIRTNNFNQQVVYEFHNGFGASVILGKYSYGLEMMLRTPSHINTKDKELRDKIENIDSDLLYDVVGYLTKERMEAILYAIKDL